MIFYEENKNSLIIVPELMISIGYLLRQIMKEWKEYTLERRKTLLNLYKKYNVRKNETLNFIEFNELILEIDPTIKRQIIPQLFIKVIHS